MSEAKRNERLMGLLTVIEIYVAGMQEIARKSDRPDWCEACSRLQSATVQLRAKLGAGE